MWPQTIWRSAFQNLTWIEKKRKIEFPKVSLLRRTKCYQNLVLAQFRNRETLYLITANFEVASKISNWKSFSQKKWWIGGRICRWDQMVFFLVLVYIPSFFLFSLCEYGTAGIECVLGGMVGNGYRCPCFCPTQENQSGLDKKSEREIQEFKRESIRRCRAGWALQVLV